MKRRKYTMKWDNAFPEVPKEFHERVRATASTLERSQNKITFKRERTKIMKFKPLIAAAVAFCVIGALTAGALTGGFTFLQNLLGNNPALLENVQSDINYEITENTFEGITFEPVGLYADEEAVFFAVNIIADEPIFGTVNPYLYAAYDKLYRIDNMNQITNYLHGTKQRTHEVYYVDENTLMVVWYISDTGRTAEPGDEHAVSVFNLSYWDVIGADAYVTENAINWDESEYSVMEEWWEKFTVILANGEATINFTVDELSDSRIVTFPDTALKCGAVVTELRMNPFGLRLQFDRYIEVIHNRAGPLGDDEFDEFFDLFESIRIVMISGEIRDIGLYFGGAGITPEPYLSRYFRYDQTFDINEIAAVIFDGVEIPLV
jgi:hypothetical protein